VDLSKLRAELRRDEGTRLQSYRDTEGNWTVGVGHLLGTYRRVVEITTAEANAWLDMDITSAAALAQELGGVPAPENDVRFRALVNMAFNLGSRLAGFKDFLAAYKAGDWARAAEEMMDSKWAQQVPTRAERLRNMILTGRA